MNKNTQQIRNDQSFAALRSLIWHYKWRFFTIDILRIASSVSISFLPLFVAQFAVSMNDEKRAFKFLVLLFAVNVFHWATWHLADYILVQKVVPTYYEFKKIAFEMFWNNSYSQFIEKPSGKVGHYVNQLRHYTRDIHDSYHYGFLPIISSLPVYVYLFYTTAWQNSIIYLMFILIALTTLIFMTRPMRKYQHRLTDEESNNAGRVFDSYANFVNVFSFRAQRKEVARNNEQIVVLNKKDIQAGYRIMNYWTIASTLVRIGLWGTILFYSWHMYQSGRISFEALIVSCTVLIDFTNQYWNLVHHIGLWNQNTSRYRESYTYLFPNKNVIQDFYRNRTIQIPSQNLHLNNSLEVRNLNFAYPDAPDNQVLRDINLTIAKNEKIGIVGKSGSGKSTLTKILLGFYDNYSGEILVDNKNIDTDELAELYAYVPQDTTLFQETLKYNIAYASTNPPTMEDIKNAAKKAHISEFIESLPLGYDTLVGERGVKLSLGQRQRIAIARAFLKESDLLILDEATSALDSQTESYVQSSFEKLWEQKSVIAIAHRLSTLNNVDRIVVMSKGEIVEQGTKEELLALDGHFADLWNHQRKGMI